MSAVVEAGQHAQLATRPTGLVALQAFEQPSTAKYPEWNWERKEYRPDWCSVIELDPALSLDAPPVRALPDIVLQRNLARHIF